MSQPKFDKDIELAKINVASQYKTGNYLTMVGFILAAFFGFLALYYQSTSVHEGFGYFAGLSILTGLFIALLYSLEMRPFLHYMGYLNDAIKQIEIGQAVGDLNNVIKGKRA
jgi:hypothetical protein